MPSTRRPPSVVERSTVFTDESAGEGDGRTMEGYGAVWNSPAQIDGWEGRFEEEIQRGAFARSLAEHTPVVQFNHGHDPKVGALPIGSVQSIREDSHGLFVSARLYEHADAVREAIAGGSITGMSFRFRIRQDTWTDATGNVVSSASVARRLYQGDDLKRMILAADVMELGPVVHPAYSATSVGVRNTGHGLPSGVRASLLRELDIRRAALR